MTMLLIHGIFLTQDRHWYSMLWLSSAVTFGNVWIRSTGIFPLNIYKCSHANFLHQCLVTLELMYLRLSKNSKIRKMITALCLILFEPLFLLPQHSSLISPSSAKGNYFLLQSINKIKAQEGFKIDWLLKTNLEMELMGEIKFSAS